MRVASGTDSGYRGWIARNEDAKKMPDEMSGTAMPTAWLVRMRSRESIMSSWRRRRRFTEEVLLSLVILAGSVALGSSRWSRTMLVSSFVVSSRCSERSGSSS